MHSNAYRDDELYTLDDDAVGEFTFKAAAAVILDVPRRDPMLDKEFEVGYALYVRAKDSDSEQWTYMQQSNNVVKGKCIDEHHICTYFPVGFVPFIEHDMYDVAVEILPSDSLDADQSLNIDFHIAYFNERFTTEQLILKVVFTYLTLGVFLALSGKLLHLLIVKNVDISKIQFDTLCTWALVFLLLCGFDDPGYYFHVQRPGFLSYFLYEFGIAAFTSGLLIFWLRDVARHRSKELEEGATKMQKFLHRSMGRSRTCNVFLVFMYVLTTVVFMALYCIFYISVEGNPGAGEISINQQGKNELLRKALFATYAYLGLYYLYYFVSLCNNLRLIVDLEKSALIIFCFSQVMHLQFICAVLLGVFSRHFENGGVQVYFYAVCNVYVYALAYLSWPVEYYFKEYDIDVNDSIQSLDQDAGAANQSDVVSPQQIEL